ncbi:lactosylceramide 4-alpha-galactosyltransferase-like [Cloeon dipterum]|uniref:lactosylceramide 4-alpha-galactosyltransferase-like n=1 Tax=Cloeon dipterum TaxID=197152 RepID=UPI00321F7E2E
MFELKPVYVIMSDSLEQEEPNVEISCTTPEPKSSTITQQTSLENVLFYQNPAEIGGDALEILDSRNESRKSIFFIESSRRGTITARQICAVESTARHNPEADIFLLLLDPPEDPDLSEDKQVLTLLRHHSNVQLLRIESTTFYANSPLQEWSNANRINTSVHPIEHASDILRVVTILKYGGVYLDLDFVIQQSLASLPPNWLSFEMGSEVCNGAFGFKKGHPMVQMMAKELAETFDGSNWGHNGPSMVSRVMSRTCGMTRPEILNTGKKCAGVVVFKSDIFFPISYPSWGRYFDEAAGPEVMLLAKDSLGVHLFNFLSHGAKVTLGSNQAYSLLAQKHCPRAYWGCSEIF